MNRDIRVFKDVLPIKINLTWVRPEVMSMASIVQIKVGLTKALLSVSIIREVLVSLLEEVFFRPVSFDSAICVVIPRRE